MKKTISLILTLAIMASFAVPAGAYAPRIGNVSLNQVRTTITLNFTENVEVKEGVDLASCISIKKDSASATTLPFGSTAVCDGSTVKIQLTTPLNSANTVVTIASGTFVGQTSDVVSPSFDAKGPESVKKVSVDTSKKVVTIEFDGPIESALGTNTLYEGDVMLARNGSSFNEEIPENQIAMDGEAGKITITLSTALSGENSRFKIAAGSLAYAKSKNVNLEEIVTPAISAAKIIPKFDPKTGLTLDQDFATITMTFDKNIYFASETIQNRIDEYILISRNNSEFYPLNVNDRVTISGNVLTIQLKFPVDSDYNKIRIRENVLMGENGDLIDTVIESNSFGLSDMRNNAPVYKSVSYDKAKKQVSIKFSETIYAVSISSLKNMIQISRNGGSFEALSYYDTAEIYGKDTILITLETGLTGTKNKFKILPNSIKGADNNVQTIVQLTGEVDTSADSMEDFEAELKVSDDMKTVDIVFDRAIQSNFPYDEDLEYLKSEISIKRTEGYKDLTAYDYISISGRTLRIMFQRAISDTDVIQIGKYALKDSQGTIMANDLKVGISMSGTKELIDLDSGVTLSADKKTVTIAFNERVYNNMSSLSSLKNMIRVAYNGVDYEELEDDVDFEFEGTGVITITFPQTISNEEARIKILPGALQNSKGETITDEIVTNPLGRSNESTKVTIDGTRVYIGTEEETTDISDNRVYTMSIGHTKATSIIGSMSTGGTFKVEFPQYAYGSTLEMSGATLQQLIEKDASVVVSAAGATQVFKANELQLDEALANLGIEQSLPQNVTLEIGISRVDLPYRASLTEKAEMKSFDIISDPVELTVMYTGVNETYAVTKYPEYMEKRFSLKSGSTKHENVTVVRVESSGKINPVPTEKKLAGSSYYLSARVKNNGVYAVIAASRSFTDTPAWAEEAVNTLASRLILQNASGGPFRAQDAVSRAEVAEMVTRALGLLTDKSGASSFFDVSLTDWYFPSTTIAVENDLIRGYGDGTFGPERNITRQEVMTIMARVMEYLGYEENINMTIDEAEEILSKFKDGDKVADWAKINMAKCVKADVVRGDDKMYLNPNAHLTRAEMSQLIYNLMSNYGLLG